MCTKKGTTYRINNVKFLDCIKDLTEGLSTFICGSDTNCLEFQYDSQ